MKPTRLKLTAFILGLALAAPFFAIDSFADTEDAAEEEAFSAERIEAEAAVLIDADTGQVLFDKKMTKRMYPASTTKIMTGLLAVEHCDPQEIITVSERAVNSIGYNSSHIALQEGEQLTVNNALYALMLPSANDAANAIAEHIAGSQENFAGLMTERAKELGAVNTSFRNAHGLHDNRHYTTALDMALITKEAARYQQLLGYMGTDRYTMPATNLQAEARPFTNQQYMLLSDMWVYDPEVLGGKVGYTTEARHTMSTIARQGDRTLICVVMNTGKDQKFYDTQLLLEYGFSEFYPYQIPMEEFELDPVPVREDDEIIGSAGFYLDEDVTVWLHNSVDPSSVSISFDSAAAFQREDEKTAAALISTAAAPEAWIPAVLLRQELQADVTITELAASALLQVPKQSGSFHPGNIMNSLYGAVVLFMVGLVLVIISLFSIRRHQMRKRMRRRAARNRGYAKVYDRYNRRAS